jgi:hypothetical protein
MKDPKYQIAFRQLKASYDEKGTDLPLYGVWFLPQVSP